MVSISLIVPIYNMEKLMRKCLDSILAQTFTDYECLLIDDGSKDGSPAICDEYAAKDSRIKAFHKPNGGLSDARNYGLARAQGEYTTFFDPDDWADEDCLKDLHSKAQETDADMVICDYYNEDPYRRECTKQTPTSLDHQEVLKDVITGKLFGYTWNKLLKRELYSRFRQEYIKGMYGCEDQYTMCALLKNDIKIAYLPKAYYHYMHYGNETQSRKYDMSVYEMDIHTREMFCSLLKDTPYQQLAYDCKSNYILHRAFLYGKQTFTSKMFKGTFQSYQYLVKDARPLYFKYFYGMSLAGYYHTARMIFGIIFNAKQLLKQIKNRIH